MNTMWINSQQWKNVKSFMISITALLVLTVYVIGNLNPHQQYLSDTPTNPYFLCHKTPEKLRNLVQLVEDATTVLDTLNITSFLIYGSLWGVYRFQGPLPWDYDADIGIIGDENYFNTNKDDFIKAFEKKGIQVQDDWQSASYKLWQDVSGSLGIFVFSNYRGMMKRPGIESWATFIHYNLYHTFPAWMVETPLPKMRFGWLVVRVPRGKRAILRYLYPFDWQTEFLPAACKRNKITAEYLTKFVSEKVNNWRPKNYRESQG